MDGLEIYMMTCISEWDYSMYHGVEHQLMYTDIDRSKAKHHFAFLDCNYQKGQQCEP